MHRLRFWWFRRWGAERRRATLGWLFAAAFVVLFLAAGFRVGDNSLSEPTAHSSSAPSLVELTLVHDAEAKGALCLDGSPPAYHLMRGFGSGSDKWLVHLEGGGWCLSLDSCSFRKSTPLGSSNYMERHIPFVGILSNIPSQNPGKLTIGMPLASILLKNGLCSHFCSGIWIVHCLTTFYMPICLYFYNWNKVKVRYCDGASFSGYRESEVQNGTILYFRGQRIWEAIMGELLQKGLANAKQALLTGCSAGGLATFIHCDDFRALLPNVATVKCVADAGFFLNEKDISGKRFIQSLYSNVVQLQDVGNRFLDCVSRMEPSQCFFPEEIIKNVMTPFFILNAAYDFWQLQYILVPAESDPEKAWLRCKQNIQHCDSNQLQTLQGFRNAMLSSLSEFKQKKKNGGMFINSCFAHCQSIYSYTWHSPNSPRINNKTIAEAVGDWFFDRKEAKEIDCPYPCNPTCYNVDLSQLSSVQLTDPNSRGLN